MTGHAQVQACDIAELGGGGGQAVIGASSRGCGAHMGKFLKNFFFYF